MTHEEMIKVLEAHRNGKEIEISIGDENKYYSYSGSIFHFGEDGYKYRVKENNDR